MRIMSVCRAYPTHRAGGMLHVVQDRAEELARQGHEVHVVTTGEPATPAGLPDIPDMLNGVYIHHTDCAPMTYSATFAANCLAAVRRLVPDALHLDSADFNNPWWCQARGIVKQCVAITMHGFGMGAALTQWNMFTMDAGPAPKVNWESLRNEAQLLRNSFDVVIGISVHERNMLRDLYGAHVELVYNPIHKSFISRPPVTAPPDGPYVCAAVSGHAERNFELAKRAAKIAGVELVVAKDLPRSAMPAFYDRCRGVLLPTYYAQGYDLVVAEAACRGRVTFATSVGSYALEAPHEQGLAMVPLGMDVEEWATMLRNHFVPDCNTIYPGAWVKHAPDVHVRNWLGAVS